MLRFILLTALLAALVVGGVLAGVGQGWFEKPSQFTQIINFLALSTIVVYWFTVRRLGVAPQDFVKIYLGATVLRILFFGGYILVIIRKDPAGARQNALLFLVCYFLFTALEVAILFRQINSQKRTNRGQKDR